MDSHSMVPNNIFIFVHVKYGSKIQDGRQHSKVFNVWALGERE